MQIGECRHAKGIELSIFGKALLQQLHNGGGIGQ